MNKSFSVNQQMRIVYRNLVAGKNAKEAVEGFEKGTILEATKIKLPYKEQVIEYVLNAVSETTDLPLLDNDMEFIIDYVEAVYKSENSNEFGAVHFPEDKTTVGCYRFGDLLLYISFCKAEREMWQIYKFVFHTSYEGHYIISTMDYIDSSLN